MRYDEYVNSLKEHTRKTVTNSLVLIIIAKFPVLNSTPLKFVLNKLIEAIISLAVDQTELAAFFQYVDFRVDKQGRDFYKTLVENIQIRNTGSIYEIQQSENDVKNKFRDLVKLTN